MLLQVGKGGCCPPNGNNKTKQMSRLNKLLTERLSEMTL